MCKAIVWIQTWDVDVQGHRLDTDLGYRCARPSFGYRLGIWMYKAIVWIQTWDIDAQGHRFIHLASPSTKFFNSSQPPKRPSPHFGVRGHTPYYITTVTGHPFMCQLF